jgi:hypothetical protein
MTVIIEYYAEPLSPDKKGKPQRAQLWCSVTMDGEAVEPTHKVGSPAPWETVKAHEEIIRL